MEKIKKRKKPKKQSKIVKATKPKSKTQALDELLYIVLPKIVEECHEDGYKPSIQHIINIVLSRVDIIKTGVLGFNFIKIERSLPSIIKRSIQNCLIEFGMLDDISFDFNYYGKNANKKIFLIKKEYDTCDSLIAKESLKNYVDVIVYNSIGNTEMAYIKQELNKDKVFFCSDFSPEGLAERNKVENLCTLNSMGFENVLLNKDQTKDSPSLKIGIKEKLKYKDYIRENGDRKYLIDLIIDRDFIRKEVEKIIQ